MIIQCDFDGTITRNNLSVLLREKFACGEWQNIEAEFLEGRISVEQSNMLQYPFIKESKEELQQFVRQHIEVRPGFREFIKYCRDNAIQFVIVSSGLDFYIDAVLAQIGMADLELYCGQANFGKDGISVCYTDPDGICINEGFKYKYLTRLKERDGTIIYIGDGLSDFEAAREADYVFATNHLLELLRAESVVCSSFDDFHDLTWQIQQLSP